MPADLVALEKYNNKEYTFNEFLQKNLKIRTKAKEMEKKLPAVPKSSSNHFANFILACQGKEKTRSPFSVSAPLSQVFCLGVIAQQTNRKLIFDRKTKQITNDPFANALLAMWVMRLLVTIF